MAGYGFRPSYVWYVPKPINDIDRIFDAFEILRNKFDSKTWSSFQLKFSKELEDNGIKYGNGGQMASRNWFTTFMYLGLAYKGDDGLIHITDVGKSVNSSNRKEIVTKQLMKMQYPNPYQSKYVKGVFLFPYRIILGIILKLPEMKITAEELGLFIMGLKKYSEKDITPLVKRVASYRKSKYSKKQQIKNSILMTYTTAVKERFKEKGKALSEIDKDKVWAIIYDYARRHFLTLEYTGLCIYKRRQNYLAMPKNKVLTVRGLLHYNPPTATPSVYKDSEEWFYYYGSESKHDLIDSKALSKKRYKLNKILTEAEKMKEKSKRIDIKHLSEVYGIPANEILKELKDHGYAEEEAKEQTEHHKVIYKLAKLGKSMGFSVHVGETEQGINEKLRSISTTMNTNHFGIPDSVFGELREVDLVWLKKDRFVCLFEVENGEIDREINKFRDLIVTTQLKAKYYIVVPDKNQRSGLKRLNSVANKKERISNKITLLTYTTNFRKALY